MRSASQCPGYSLADCGCYVDGAKGIYVTDDVVAFARDHGAEIVHDDDGNCVHDETCFKSEFGGCEFSGEYEDEANEYMEATYGVDGASWGRNEQGDWGLWAHEDE